MVVFFLKRGFLLWQGRFGWALSERRDLVAGIGFEER